MDVLMPQLGETVAEGTVTKWHCRVGDSVRADDALFDVETDKVSTEIPAPASGVLTEILVGEGVTAAVGTCLAVIREAQTGTAEERPALLATPPPGGGPAAADLRASNASRERRTGERLSPVVRRLLEEHGLDSARVTGTGRDGRITREDVLQHVARGGLPVAGGRGPDTEPVLTTAGVPLNAVRRRTAEHVAKAWATVPHVLQVVDADFSRVDLVRRMRREDWRRREGFSLTYLPFIACATAAALLRFPRLNASFREDRLVLHPRVNLGLAVDLNHDGLVVPVLKDAARKSLAELAREAHDLALRARESRLRPDDVTEATYTITNNGAYGTLFTAPIVSHPQVAILSMDAVRKRPVVIESPDGDAIAIRPVGMLAQTFDHRAVDGAYAAAFLGEVKSVLEARDWAQELPA